MKFPVTLLLILLALPSFADSDGCYLSRENLTLTDSAHKPLWSKPSPFWTDSSCGVPSFSGKLRFEYSTCNGYPAGTSTAISPSWLAGVTNTLRMYHQWEWNPNDSSAGGTIQIGLTGDDGKTT